VESGTFAFETTIKNAVTGIGQEVVSFADAYGSGGRLSSLVVMDDLGKYPADPASARTARTRPWPWSPTRPATAGARPCSSATPRASPPTPGWAASAPTGASTATPTPRSSRATTSRTRAGAASGP
jgi:hypothetical protein